MKKWYVVASMAALISLSLMACGQAPPSFQEVESNLNSPTGTVDKGNTTNAWGLYQNGQKSMSMPGLSQYGKMPQFLTTERGGLVPFFEYLSKAGIPVPLIGRIAPYLPLNNNFATQNVKIVTQPDGALRPQQVIPNVPDMGLTCVKISGSLTGASAEIAIDLKCTGEGTGSIIVRYEAQGGVAGGEFTTDVIFSNACSKDGDCVDGVMRFKMSVSGLPTNVRCADGSEGTRCGADNAKAQMLFTLRVRVTSGGQSWDIKQGMRLLMDGGQKALVIEVLVWVLDDQKQESTLVLILEASASSGSASFSVKGKNGTFTCSSSDKGKTGKCTGTGTATGEFIW